MILSKKQSKALGYNNTIDLKLIMAKEYINQKEKSSGIDYILYILYWVGLIYIIYVGISFLAGLSIAEAKTTPKTSIVGCINKYTSETRLPRKVKPGKEYASCFYGKGWQNITVRSWSLYLYEHFSKTYMLDSLTIQSIECSERNGVCNNGREIGSFQINKKAHPYEYKVGLKLANDKKYHELYLYQALWTVRRMIQQEKKNCVVDKFSSGWNEVRFKCLAKSHNGNNSPDFGGKSIKENYANKGWIVRQYIKSYLLLNHKEFYESKHD